MAIAVTGSVQNMVFSGADPAGQNVTVASDAKIAICFVVGFTAAGLSLASLSLGGQAMTLVGIAVSGDENAVYVAYLVNPPTGTQSLDPAWSASPAEGPLFQFVCLNSGAGTIISVIDADVDSNVGFGTASATSNSNTGDFAIAQAEGFGGAPTIGGTGAANVTGGAYSNNSEFGQLFTVTAGAATTNATSNGIDSYPSVGLIILREAAAPAGADTPAQNVLNFGTNF